MAWTAFRQLPAAHTAEAQGYYVLKTAGRLDEHLVRKHSRTEKTAGGVCFPELSMTAAAYSSYC